MARTHRFAQSVPWPREHVFEWFSRPGALQRLSPPWQRLQPGQEASSLRSGQATLKPRLGPSWVARHEPEGFAATERFEDVCASQPWQVGTRWRHVHRFADAPGGGTLVIDEVTTRLPRSMVASVFDYRHRKLLADLAAIDRMRTWCSTPLTIGVTGAGGLIGRDLCAALTTGGHRVVPFVRGEPTTPVQRQWDPASPHASLLDGLDVLIHLAGEPIAGRFTQAHMDAIRDSRVQPTRRLAECVAARGGSVALVVASAIGIYGADRGDEVLTEHSAPGEGFLAEVVQDWEEACEPARKAGARTVNVRTGLVLSGRGGLLKALRPLYSTGLGGRLGDGQQWMSWVAIDDIVDMYVRAATDVSLNSPVNGVAPTAVRGTEFTGTLADVLSRPAIAPVPEWAPRLLLGATGAEELALASQRVVPESLVNAGQAFRFLRLEDALRHELGR